MQYCIATRNRQVGHTGKHSIIIRWARVRLLSRAAVHAWQTLRSHHEALTP